MRALVVDDESLARARLRRLLENENVDVVAEAENALSLTKVVQEHNPDVVFLDIEMPGADGIDAAKMVHGLPIVFITAFSEYAAKAFELNAVDYLLKPITAKRLEATLARLMQKANDDKLYIRDSDDIYAVSLKQAEAFIASDKYVAFYHQGKERLTRESLDRLEERLGAHGFMRIHRSALVNVDKIVSLTSNEAGKIVVLESGKEVPVGRRRVSELKAILLAR